MNVAHVDQRDQVKLLIAAVQDLSEVRTALEVQAVIRRTARRIVGADGAALVLREGSQCHYVGEDAIAPLWAGERFPIHSCVSGHAMIDRAPIAIEDITLDARVRQDTYEATFVKSLLMVPIGRNEPIGAIGAYWAEHHRPTSTETELLQALAHSAAVALESVRMATQLERARLETLHRLALAGEFRDDETFQHTQRVANTAGLLGRRLGLDSAEIALVVQAAALHDIGKIAVPDALLLKPGKLTAEEFDIVKQHTTAGWRLLSGTQSDVLARAAEIALSHHERWDGSGYPQGLAGDSIPLSARLTAVADVFDSLTHARPYKAAWPVAEAVAEIRRASGSQFDPAIVEAFNSLDPMSLVEGPRPDPMITEIVVNPVALAA